MKKALKFLVRGVAVVILLLVLATLGGWLYLRQHKSEVLARLKQESARYLNGDLTVGDVGFSLFHTFPKVSITVADIHLQDSLWTRHHHDLLSVGKAFASIDLFQLFRGKVQVDRLVLEEARIYLYTDSNGYRNTSVFRKRESPGHSGHGPGDTSNAAGDSSHAAGDSSHAAGDSGNTAGDSVNAAVGTDSTQRPHFPLLDIRNGSFIVEKKDRGKYFSFTIPKLLCQATARDDAADIDLELNLRTTVNSLAFNQEKGSFIEGKEVAGRFHLRLNTDSRILSFSEITLNIDDQPFVASGRFLLAEVPTPFEVSLRTESLPYRKAAAFVTGNIRKKLDLYSVREAFDSVECRLNGMDTNYRTPLLYVRALVKDKTVITPLTTLQHASFWGEFGNQADKRKDRDDPNSLMRFTGFKADWNGMTMESDSILIRNLTRPVIRIGLRSDFALENLNSLLDPGTFTFTKGRGKLNVLYIGPLTDQPGVMKRMTGLFTMDDAVFTYLPRNFNMSQGRGRIRFTGKDVAIDALRINTGSTTLNMTGSIANLFSLIDESTGRLTVDWNILSDRINVNDFRGFLKKRPGETPAKGLPAKGAAVKAPPAKEAAVKDATGTAPPAKNASAKKVLLSSTLSRVTDLLENASMRLKLASRSLVYKKFSADDLHTDITLDNDAIALRHITLKLAEGSLSASADVRNDPTANPFSFQAQLSGVHVDQVMAAFNGFGQTALTDKNLKGKLNATIDLFGEVTEGLEMIPDSTRGQIDFKLEEGELIDFEPLQKISHTVFKKRDFNNIRFADLQDRFQVNGNNITINRMEIRSTVFTMFVEGLFNMKKGADFSIQVPLSNLKKGEIDIAPENLDPDRKVGLSAHLRAKTGDDGKLKVSWDPFKKGLKKLRREQTKSARGGSAPDPDHQSADPDHPSTEPGPRPAGPEQPAPDSTK